MCIRDSSGTTGITSFGTNYNGPRFLRFTGALTITHNSITLNLPGAANVITAAGDTCIAIPNSSANGWNIVSYQIAANAPGVVTTATTATTATNLAGGVANQIPYQTGTGSTSFQYKSDRIQPVDYSLAGNALTLKLNPTTLDFRSTTLTDGSPTTISNASQITMSISSGSTLGTTSAVQSDIAILAINNAGTMELAAVNISGGIDLSETGLISTTAEGGAGAADSANTIYSTTARTNVAYRVVGLFRSTQATAGTWASAPSLIQGNAGRADSVFDIAIGYSTATTSGTSVDLTVFSANAKRINIIFEGVSTNGTSAIMIQLGTGGAPETSGYNAFGFGFTGSSVLGVTYTAGFGIQNSAAANDGHYGVISLVRTGALSWAITGNGSCGTTATGFMLGGTKTLAGNLDLIRLTTAGGVNTFDGGSIKLIVE